jgi:hypothetical protein
MTIQQHNSEYGKTPIHLHWLGGPKGNGFVPVSDNYRVAKADDPARSSLIVSPTRFWKPSERHCCGCFLSSEGQFTASVSGWDPCSPARVTTTNFFPSGARSYMHSGALGTGFD